MSVEPKVIGTIYQIKSDKTVVESPIMDRPNDSILARTREDKVNMIIGHATLPRFASKTEQKE